MTVIPGGDEVSPLRSERFTSLDFPWLLQLCVADRANFFQVLFEEAGTSDGIYGEANIWKLQPKIIDAVLHLGLQEVKVFFTSPWLLPETGEWLRKGGVEVVEMLFLC